MPYRRCPCCGCRTLSNEPPGSFEICPVCFWEDDKVQFDDPTFRGGANEDSLEEARANYQRIAACSSRFIKSVRPPTRDELT
ncbi:hydrolase [bacterium]|nr:hydrolase [bacterium]